MWQFCGKLVNRLPLFFRHPNRIFLSNGKHPRKALLFFVFLNKLTDFFAFQMVARPRPNLFKMLINLTSPKWLDRLGLLACYIDTCGKKIQSEIIIQIKRWSAPHLKIGNFICESWQRLLTKEKQDAFV